MCNLFWQFINHLINQLARHQFLKIACQLEKKNMLGAYSLVKVIESELQAYVSATKGRVVHIIIIIFFFGFCSLSPPLSDPSFVFGIYMISIVTHSHCLNVVRGHAEIDRH